MKYCEPCNTWIKNHPAAIAMHEQGQNHKSNVAKREFFFVQAWARSGALALPPHRPSPSSSTGLHEMRQKADQDEKDAAATKKALGAVETEALAQYEADKAAAAAVKESLGSWVRRRRVLGKVGGVARGEGATRHSPPPPFSLSPIRKPTSRATCTTPSCGTTTASARVGS